MDITESLVIRDSAGRPCIVLSANDRLPFISLGRRGEAEILLEVDGESGRITIRRPDGTNAAVIASRDETVSVVAFDRTGLHRGRLRIDTNLAEVEGELLNADATTRWEFKL